MGHSMQQIRIVPEVFREFLRSAEERVTEASAGLLNSPDEQIPLGRMLEINSDAITVADEEFDIGAASFRFDLITEDITADITEDYAEARINYAGLYVFLRLLY